MSMFHFGVFKDEEYVLTIKLKGGQNRRVLAKSIYYNKNVQARFTETKAQLFHSWFYSLFIPLPFVFFYLRFVLGQGSHQVTDEHVRGVTENTPKFVQDRVDDMRKKDKRKKAQVKFCGFTIPDTFETQNFLLAGGPGTGKSGQISEMLHDIRRGKGRAIVYDRSGTFVETFYRPGKDIILNPLDERGVHWDIFSECTTKFEFDEFASAFIPDAKSSDPFWTLGPRAVFSALLYKESKKPHPSIEELINIILQMPLETMMKYVKWTDAASVISEGAEKTASGVRASMAVYVNCLRLLRERSAQRFCISEWVKDESNEDSFVFITSNKENESVLRSLITAYIHIATKSILGMTESKTRRIWCFYDELPTLKKLEILQSSPAEARKYGGCFVFGFQSYPQMVDVYGENGMAALAGGCATALITRANEPKFAKWCAEYAGQNETAKASENLSFGHNEVRDAVNMSKTRGMQDVVIPAQFRALPDYEGYVVFGRDIPVTRLRLPYTELPAIAEPFVPCNDINEVAVPISEDDMHHTSLEAALAPLDESDISTIDNAAVASDGTFGGSKPSTGEGGGQDLPEQQQVTTVLPTLGLNVAPVAQMEQEEFEEAEATKRRIEQNIFDNEQDR
ncbi:traM recognition site of TraD and TraG family protein [Alteromonas macleodii]|uniref:TraM recognition site of TraD and TraG family protein n=2 Tax=Alteromonas macleodii TaxID=28108 RepID=A0AB36FLA8_ALTMA|nr:traM recognition site of TraD and TraG family protein [Alteromonas macleodii]OES24867.1 traM recognition site of TraD and TraG family protein [Alteromonas macleodii]OES25145.1 traM recognition site of TraD and TraG family protein [Alteromonas macleodii]OES39186.1 traM recognition site of TraD and TraG family protein [Alteromonas macleodii]